MITLISEKDIEQLQAQLKRKVKPVEISYLFVPFTYRSSENELLGKIEGSRFYLILPNRSMGHRLPLRFFIGELINAEGKTVITGKFRYHPSVYIAFSVVYSIILISNTILFAGGSQDTSLLLIWGLGIPLIFTMYILLGTFRSKRNYSEKETIEFIKKIIRNG